jgi:cysteine synthase A
MVDTTTPTGAADLGWVHTSIAQLERESARSADTHLLQAAFPGYPGIGFYLKDEAAHPTGSLKHRLARSLFLYALCNGRLRAGQLVVDASSGSTAISEAWFARLLGLRFLAVVPQSTEPGKLGRIRALGGDFELLAANEDCVERARAVALSHRGCFLDQFGLAERATDWRGNNNIAESIIGQMRREPVPDPTWIVCGAGTGGTSATIGRYLRYRQLSTQLCVAEPQGGAFACGYAGHSCEPGYFSLIEGIGRPRVEPGFVFDVVDRVIEVDDDASCAAAHALEDIFGQRYGGSSGTNLVACLQLAAELCDRGVRSGIVTLLCDRGERYADTLYHAGWLDRHVPKLNDWRFAIGQKLKHGGKPEPCAADGTAVDAQQGASAITGGDGEYAA